MATCSEFQPTNFESIQNLQSFQTQQGCFSKNALDKLNHRHLDENKALMQKPNS